jgi:ribose transport system substrate-binding protein
MQPVRRMLMVVSILVVASLLLSACGTQSATPTAVPQAQAEAPKGVVLNGVEPIPGERYVMVTFLSGIEFWKPAFEGMKTAAKQLGIEAVYQGTELYDAQAQATVLEQVIATKPNCIITTAQQPEALRPTIDKAVAAGIPVIQFDSDSPKSNRLSFLATDNYNAGASAGKIMAQLTNCTGSVGIITTPGQLNLDQRSQGFSDYINANCPNMKVIGECKGLGDMAVAASCASGFLQGNADLSGVFSTGSDGGPASVQAFREAGRLGDIKIVGFDIDQATIEAIKKGEIDATIVQAAWNMGYWATWFCYTVVHDMVQPLSDYKAAGISPLPAVVDTGTYIVTKDNVQYFEAK